METLTLLAFSVLPAIVIAAGLHDLTTMTIPNWMSGILIVAFFPAAYLVGLTPGEVGVHLGVAAVALFFGMGLFAMGVIGGGDAKLMASACLWLGLSGSGMFLLWTGLAGGFFCAGLIFARTQMRPYLAGGPHWVDRLLEPEGDLPYGVAIAIGVLMAFPASAMVALFAAGR